MSSTRAGKVEALANCEASLSITRRCTYRNLYLLDGTWVFAMADGESAPPLCDCVMRDCDVFFAPQVLPLSAIRATVTNVTPPASSPNRTFEPLYRIPDPTFVNQKYNRNFVHSFFEELFEFYWAAAELQGRWELQAPLPRQLITGTLSTNYSHELWTQRFQPDGRSRDAAVSAVLTALSGRNVALFVKTLPVFSVFSELSVGGSIGRSVWTAPHYLTTDGKATRKRTAADDEHSLGYLRCALRHYYEHVGRRLLAGRSTAPYLPPYLPDSQMYGRHRVVVFNRKHAEIRHMKNAAELRAALAQMDLRRADEARVAVDHLEPGPLHEIAAALRSVLLLVTPHGAQIAHAPFMPPGSGLIEVLPEHAPASRGERAFETNMYEQLAVHAGLRYAPIRANGGFNGALTARIPPLCELVGAMLAQLPDAALAAEVEAEKRAVPRADHSDRNTKRSRNSAAAARVKLEAALKEEALAKMTFDRRRKQRRESEQAFEENTTVAPRSDEPR